MNRSLTGAALAAAVLSLTLIPAASAATLRFPEARQAWYGSRLPSAARREVSKLQREEALAVIPIPVFGVNPGGFGDSWGDARSNGRSHEGVDILATKGTYVIAPTRSVVAQIGYGENGGNYVYTINPGGERFYFAHLDRYADGLEAGDILDEGDLIGYVGNTGNASGGPAHLHFGIYAGGAQNPYPRLTATLPLEVRVDAIARIIEDADDPAAEARVAAGMYPAFFRQAVAAGETLPKEIAIALAPRGSGANAEPRDLTLGSQGTDVAALQQFLISWNAGPASAALKAAGATGYFGQLTRAALAEWQAAVGISPAAGYYGPLTRTRIAAS